jgi:cysteine desulfurase / selenocysteine lyase
MPDIASEFPIAAQAAYFNTAALGPWPTRTVRAVQTAMAAAQVPGAEGKPGELPVFGETRARLARLLGAQPDDFVFTPNTSAGLSICMHGIDWRAGDNVIVPHSEFPSVHYALAHLPALGVELRKATWAGAGPTPDELLAHADGRTRALICSAIAWDTGFRVDLTTLGPRCAERGILLVLDGIHAVGAEPLALAGSGIAALAFHGYKWLLAGFGCGVLYVAPTALAQIQPVFIGHKSADGPLEHPEWKPGAARYATGTQNEMGAHALNASLTLIEETGIGTIAAHNHALADELEAGLRHLLPDGRVLRDASPAQQSAIVVFSAGSADQDAALVARLTEHGVIVALRPAGIRVAPHFFNTPADVARLLGAIAQAR